ncbi:MAG: Stp1/IreP family PP2C-type Ser/Thr phosphatase [Clostridiales bacterium]|nr:Stp1/IreP family PP2C-type Ser/Thr phosphatase [Clostridiales bacterium]
MNFAGKSDKGLIRSRNEDSFCIIGGADGAPLLLAVADGMGGHRAGATASQMAISVISESVAAAPIDSDNTAALRTRLFELVRIANDVIYKKSLSSPEYEGMGTTLIVAAALPGKLTLAHVGDSCAYYFRDRAAYKITTDHTYVEELIRIGSLTREEAARHPKRNYITKAVGCAGRIAADFYTVALKDYDRVLLCTDGLSKMLTEPEIAEIMYASDDPAQICGRLIELSNHRGGLDNITVLAAINTPTPPGGSDSEAAV